MLKKISYLVVLITMLTGCTTVRPVEHTVTKKDSVILREKLVPFSVQETTIEKSFSHDQVDSIIQALKTLPINSRTIYYTDPKLKTQLAFMLDSLGRLVISCKTLEREFQIKISERDRIIVSQEKQLVELKKGFWEQVKHFLNTGLWSIVIVLVLIIVIFIMVRR